MGACKVNLTIEPKTHEAKTDRMEGRYKQVNYNSWRLLYSTWNNEKDFRKKIHKEIEELNNTINQLDLTDNYRTLYPTISE